MKKWRSPMPRHRTRCPKGPYDPRTGMVRVLEEMCATCIFRPGNLMHLREGRVEQMVAEAMEAESAIICHSTLPYGPYPQAQRAVCHGFWARYGSHVLGLRLARMMNVLEFIKPPSKKDGAA